MRKNMLVAVLLLGLIAALPGSATAAKKKKKVKTYKSETAEIQAGHGAFYGTAGTPVTVTAQEFLNTCAIPQSNGVDAYVFEVPEAFTKLAGTVETKSSVASPTGLMDIDLFLYDANCESTSVSQAVGGDEYGLFAKGTKYVVVHPYEGEQVTTQITIKAK